MANKWIKVGSSDNYVLLGGGGHKAISDFANAEHTHSYLPLAGGTVTGTTIFNNANTENTALKIRRYGDYETQQAAHYVEDSVYYIDYTNDDSFSSIQFRLINTDTVSGGGANVNTSIVTITGNKAGSTIYANSFVGMLTGNADTATKLQTARTIWGQNFDGTGNVDGDIVIHGAIVGKNDSNSYESYIGNASGGINDGDGALMYAYGSRNLYFYTAGAQRMIINSSGSVGIGTASPSYKLHVAGDIFTTTGFIKNGSNDYHVLLGGGGHKALSDFSMAHEHPYLPLAGGTMSGKVNFTSGQMLQWTDVDNDTNSTGCNWYGIAKYTGGDGYPWLNISNYYGINITTRGDSYLQHNGNVIYTSANLPAYPTSLPANGGNADYAESAGNADSASNVMIQYLYNRDEYMPILMTGRDSIGTAINNFVATDFSGNITYNPKQNILKAGTIYATTGFNKEGSSDSYVLLGGGGHKAESELSVNYAETAGNAGTLGGYHESAFSKNGHTHTTSEITNFPTIGNGALRIKVNGTELTPEGGTFTANKSGDSTIDLANSLATRPEINTLGDKITKINTSIAGLTAATQIKNPFDDSSEGSEESVETNNEPFTNKMGTITLNFWTKVKYINLPVYSVWVNHVADVVESFGSVSFCYDIVLMIGVPDSIMSSVGFTLGSPKPFFIRGANVSNKVCTFDVRGNGNINTARATVTGGYMNLQCRLKLYGGDSGTGNAIMEKAKNGKFNAYLCLRQTP